MSYSEVRRICETRSRGYQDRKDRKETRKWKNQREKETEKEEENALAQTAMQIFTHGASRSCKNSPCFSLSPSSYIFFLLVSLFLLPSLVLLSLLVSHLLAIPFLSPSPFCSRILTPSFFLPRSRRYREL